MIKKTIKYIDYDGNERTEDFYFNLNKVELTELEVSEKGGLKLAIERIVSLQDYEKIVAIFKEIIMKSYGEKSPDGKYFVKSPELSAAFIQTEAYVELFSELSSNAEAAAAFINGIIPKIN